jgi:hypothetical protein
MSKAPEDGDVPPVMGEVSGGVGMGVGLGCADALARRVLSRRWVVCVCVCVCVSAGEAHRNERHSAACAERRYCVSARRARSRHRRRPL